MDGLIEALLNVPSAKDGMDSYLASIRSKSDVIMTAATNVQGSSSTLLSTLNELAVEHCTAGYALLLSLHSDALSEPVYGSFLQTCIRFFERANVASASFAGFEVTRVARAMVHAAFQLNRPRAVVKALHTAVRVMSPSPSCLTCAHALLLQACIKGQCYDVAVNFLRAVPVFEIDLKNAPIQGADVVKYFYYAGICYTAVADYPSALASYFQCMSIPAQALSQVVVCAVKKARLIALIHYGSDIATSINLPGVVVRFIKQPMAEYDPLVRAFLQNDRAAMEAAIVAEQEVLSRDQNLGLAYRALDALTRHRLKRLAATFISLSLPEIARRVNLPDVAAAERAVVQGVRSGDIRASIDAATGLVRFEVDSAAEGAAGSGGQGRGQGQGSAGSLLTPQSAQLLEECLRQTLELSEKLRDMHRATVVSHKYLVKNTVAGAGGSRSGGHHVPGGPESMGMGIGMDVF